jgi:putative serine protease PepD
LITGERRDKVFITPLENLSVMYDFTSEWERRKSRKERVLVYILIALVSSVSTGVVMFTLEADYINGRLASLEMQKTVIVNGSSDVEGVIASILEDVKDSVVHVTSVKITRDFFFRPIPVEGTGSGFIISKEGYIVTNNHVIANANQLKVTLADGKEYPAQLVGADPMTDTAIIKIDAPYELKPVKMGDSDKVRVGQFAIAIGNPYRLDNTVTLGVISALNRTLETERGYKIEGVIQTDAAINPGNSGGPLLNLKGEVIGVNTAIFTTTGAYQGIGFSIPINIVKRISSDLIEKGKVMRPWMGITGTTLTEDLANATHSPVKKGVVIIDVVPGGPADRAGVRGTTGQIGTPSFSMGDIIVEFDGKEIDSMDSLIKAIHEHETGDRVKIRFFRGDAEMEADLTLGERPANQ